MMNFYRCDLGQGASDAWVGGQTSERGACRLVDKGACCSISGESGLIGHSATMFLFLAEKVLPQSRQVLQALLSQTFEEEVIPDELPNVRSLSLGVVKVC